MNIEMEGKLPRGYLEIMEKVWGRELVIANSVLYCSKILELKKDHRCSMHCHENKHETFYVQSGCCMMEWFAADDKKPTIYVLVPGTVLVMRPKTYHRFSGIADITQIIETSTMDLPEDNKRLARSEHLPNGSEVWARNEVFVPH